MSMLDKNPSRNPVTICREKSMAVQSARDEVDVNLIVKRYEKTGLLPQVAQDALFLDVTEVGDYRQLRDQINRAEAVFGQLPADIRTRFDNDAAAFVDFAADPANREALVELGLVAAEAPAPVVAAAAPEGGVAVGEGA